MFGEWLLSVVQSWFGWSLGWFLQSQANPTVLLIKCEPRVTICADDLRKQRRRLRNPPQTTNAEPSLLDHILQTRQHLKPAHLRVTAFESFTSSSSSSSAVSLPPLLPLRIQPSLATSLPASLPASLTTSLPAPLTTSLPASLTLSLPASLTTSLPASSLAPLPARKLVLSRGVHMGVNICSDAEVVSPPPPPPASCPNKAEEEEVPEPPIMP